MEEQAFEEWHFDFGLHAPEPGQLVPASKCDELLDLIIQWAEENRLCIGGGYRPFD